MENKPVNEDCRRCLKALYRLTEPITVPSLLERINECDWRYAMSETVLNLAISVLREDHCVARLGPEHGQPTFGITAIGRKLAEGLPDTVRPVVDQPSQPSPTAVGVRIMRVLNEAVAPIALDNLCHLVNVLPPEVTSARVCAEMCALAHAGWVASSKDDKFALLYGITELGRAMFLDTVDPLPSESEREPVQVAVHLTHDLPAVATCCIAEDELDEWWEQQDVECKADAFLLWALNRNGSYIDTRTVSARLERIPVAGTIGEAATA